MAEKVVVFGGSGFLGSQVCDILSKKGYRVIIFDNKKSNWLKAKQEVVVADILDHKKVDQVISKLELLALYYEDNVIIYQQ